MAIEIAGIVGPVNAADGVPARPRMGKQSEQIVSELHGRFYELAYRGALFSGGQSLTAINNVTFTSGTLGPTCTPLIAIWNPPTSGINAVVLQAVLGVAITAATNTGGGPFVWATSVGNAAALTAGALGFKRNTLAPSAGQVRFISSGNALTGLTTTLVVMGAANLAGGSAANFSFVGTAVGQATTGMVTREDFDGSLIVPPGGVLALLATTTPVAHSAVASILWEEVPI